MKSIEQLRHELLADVDDQRAGRIYAEALLNAAEKNGQGQQVFDELSGLVTEILPGNPNIEEFLRSGSISRDRKPPVIESAFRGRVTDLFVNFLLVLNKHDRLGLLRAVLVAYQDLLNERSRRARVLVRSATPLHDDQRETLLHLLRDAMQREPVIETEVDPELLGGVVVRVDDFVFDGSVRAKLLRMRKQLMERGSHVITQGR
jgi:F-type H+-transporting ATPase subunit delta